MSALLSAASSIVRRPWLDWLLPPRCGSCRSLGAWLCAPCRRRVRRLEEPLCPRCGRELEFASGNCGCRARLRALGRARAAAAYEGPLEIAIQRFKYEGWRSLAPALAGLVAYLATPPMGRVQGRPFHEAPARAMTCRIYVASSR